MFASIRKSEQECLAAYWADNITLLVRLWPTSLAKVLRTLRVARPRFILPPATVYTIIRFTHSVASSPSSYVTGRSARISWHSLHESNRIVH
jgi:hypothetical protein